jgi:uncharacterized protein (DUF885 family)
VTEFAACVDAFFAEYFAREPVDATGAGKHDRDGLWPDESAAGRADRLAFVERWRQAFAAFRDDDLDADERVDRDLLIGTLEARAFAGTELAEHAWNPIAWVYLIGQGFFSLVAREFAPLAERLASVASRAERLQPVLDAAKAALVGTDDGRPVSRLHTETALDQWGGLIGVVDEASAAGDVAAAGDPAVAAILPRLRAARDTAAAGLAALEAHLRDAVLPRAAGEGRLGPALFAAKMARTIEDPELTPDRIRVRAEREFAAVRGEMIRIAREIAPDWLGGRPVPDTDDAVVRAVLEAIGREHPAADELLDYCRAEVARIEAFCRRVELIGLADEPLEIGWTPVFLRSFANAMLSSPGPLERDQKAIFSITPIPDSWTPEQAESSLREDNDRMLRLVTIHEAVPGHYLQGVYANRCPSVARAIFGSGVFAEGWAIYATQVMIDAGYADGDPALLLTHWKYYLRAVVNALIDIGIHTAGMTEEEAVALMIDGGFQEEAQARGKYNRARLSSTQLSTYFVGSLGFWDIEHEARRRAAAAAGAPGGADAIPIPAIVGGYGQTPGFDQRAHLEAVIGHGGPPLPLLRRLLFA